MLVRFEYHSCFAVVAAKFLDPPENIPLLAFHTPPALFRHEKISQIPGSKATRLLSPKFANLPEYLANYTALEKRLPAPAAAARNTERNSRRGGYGIEDCTPKA